MLEQQRYSDFAEQLNQKRLERALSLLPHTQQQLFRLIPVLLHFQHHDLPGFNGNDTPCGIYQFSLDEITIEDCQIFNFDVSKPSNDDYFFEGIYAMGSIASFGQSSSSDVDIWAVHNKQASQHDLQLVREKLTALSSWFLQYELEVNFYLVHPDQFRQEDDWQTPCEQTLGKEHSGSAQHWLLLEEFYRSQIRLAGRTVAWWPHIKELPQLLHLGDVRQISASEYFGASLWHLYKGIEKPHKAVLKVLLLEAYASDYPNSVLLTDKIWQKTLESNFSWHNDPYFVLYQYIESYLLSQQDNKRLEVLRRCFYLKCAIKLTQPLDEDDWRVSHMKELVNSWQWSQKLLSTLDDCEHWHSGQLQWFNDQMRQSMLSSYQTLLAFASKQQLNDSLRMDELSVLTRKLHTFFQENEHHVDQLNRLWSRSIAETKLGVIHSNRDGKYYLYRNVQSSQQFIEQEPVAHSATQAGLLMWACYNGVADEKTKWYQLEDHRSKTSPLDKHSKKLLNVLQLKKTETRVLKHDLCRPWHFRHLTILLNIYQDPTQDWQGQEMMIDILNVNVLSLGRKQINMLGSIDVMSINSWGEWQCHSFSGKLAVLDLLSMIAPGLKRSHHDIKVDIVSCSKRLQKQLQQTVEKLIRQTLRLSKEVKASSTLLQPLHIGDKRYGIFINNHGIACQDLHDAKTFYQRISSNKLTQLPRPELCDDPRVCAPSIIFDYAATSSIQYFLRQQNENVEVFVLDDNNELSHYIQHDQKMTEIVSGISRHYAFEEITEGRNHFNLPQFFQLERIEGQLQVLPFGISAEEQLIDF
ncbi:MAG: class I adenylate cyclase [Parashewanella sp.]